MSAGGPKEAAMNQPKTGEAAEAARSRSDLQKELAEVLRQRAAISAVLRAIANSPHDLQPIFDTIIDSAVHLCRAEFGIFRLVAYKTPPAWSEVHSLPMLRGGGNFIGRLYASKSPVHIPDLAEHEELVSAEEADRETV